MKVLEVHDRVVGAKAVAGRCETCGGVDVALVLKVENKHLVIDLTMSEDAARALHASLAEGLASPLPVAHGDDIVIEHPAEWLQ